MKTTSKVFWLKDWIRSSSRWNVSRKWEEKISLIKKSIWLEIFQRDWGGNFCFICFSLHHRMVIIIAEKKVKHTEPIETKRIDLNRKQSTTKNKNVSLFITSVFLIDSRREEKIKGLITLIPNFSLEKKRRRRRRRRVKIGKYSNSIIPRTNHQIEMICLSVIFIIIIIYQIFFSTSKSTCFIIIMSIDKCYSSLFCSLIHSSLKSLKYIRWFLFSLSRTSLWIEFKNIKTKLKQLELEFESSSNQWMNECKRSSWMKKWWFWMETKGESKNGRV